MSRHVFTAPEPLITQELIDSLNDPRIKQIDLMIKIENELRDSIALTLVREGAQREADASLEELATVDPSDTQKIITLQAKVYRARFIAQTLMAVLSNGQKAEDSLRQEANIATDDNSQE